MLRTMLTVLTLSATTNTAMALTVEEAQVAKCLSPSHVGLVDFEFPTPLSLCVAEKNYLLNEVEGWYVLLPEFEGEISTSGRCVVFTTQDAQKFFVPVEKQLNTVLKDKCGK